MRLSPAATSPGPTSWMALDCASDVRMAAATTVPNDVSAVDDVNCATSRRESFRMAPAPSNDAAGPMPNCRRSITTAIPTATTPTATAPPRQVRFHDRCGAALIAIVVIVECTAVPPAVRGGVYSIALRAEVCTYQVTTTAGSPRPAATSATKTVQSGSPMPTTAAFARIPVATKASAQTPTAAGSDQRRPPSVAGSASRDAPLATDSSRRSRSRAVAGRSSGSLARQAAMSASSAGATPARRVLNRGASSTIWAAINLCGASPKNGGCPLSSSNARQPKA